MSSNDSDVPSTCVQCGKALPVGYAGVSCPACLFLGVPTVSGEGSSEAETIIAPARPMVEARPWAGESIVSEVIGPYRLLEKLGEGGFGVVWRAQQSEPIEREVALKVIKPGMASEEMIARFGAERQALALMDHPNIAGVLDAGTTVNGQPYFVMELVRGVPITDYCDERKLTIRQRLELFVPVCQAVQHAHQKAILHRDLKPSNILVAEVDGKAVPKVIDFGIAKAVQPTGSVALEATLLRTMEGMVIGTPQYMSPEQAGSVADIDTRSDVYALGVILYELLTGQTPLTREQLRKAAFDEALKLVREGEVARPSSRLLPVSEVVELSSKERGTEPGRLKRTLSGDLDWITLKALEKDRERRYGSAAALGADIGRHLGNEPVEAGPPSVRYRLGKLVRRHRVAVAASGAVLLSLLGGIALSTWQAVRATRAEREAHANYERADGERKRADEEAEIAKAVIEFLQNDMLRQAGSRAQGGKAVPNLTVRQALERAAERIGGRFKGRPLIEAAIRLAIGEACGDVGDHKRAVEQLEAALDLRKKELGAEHPDTLTSMGGLAAAYSAAGKLEQSLQLHEETIKLRKALLGPEHPDTLLTMHNLALAYQRAGKLEQAISLNQETLKLQKVYLGPEHPQTLNSMNNLALAYANRGKVDQAIPLFEESLKMKRVLLGSEHPDTLATMNNLALAYQKAGKVDQALSLFDQALKQRKARLGPEHPETLNSMVALAGAYKDAGKLDQALQLSEETFKLSKARLGPEHPDTLTTMNNLGAVYYSAGKFGQALPLLEEAFQLRKTRLGLEHPATLSAMNNLANAYKQSGQVDRGLPLFEEAFKLRKSKLGSEHPDTLRSMDGLARALQAMSRLDEAASLLREGLKVAQQQNAANPGRATGMEGLFLHHLADALRRQNQLPEARKLGDEAVKLYQQHSGLPANEISHAWDVLASIQEAQGDTQGAEASRREASRIKTGVKK